MASLPTPGSSDVWGANLNAAIESLHLGPDTHANRPTTGLTKGTLYSCTDHKLVYKWSGSAWGTYATVGDDTAASTTFTPTGNIAATNVQAALAEVDSEKETPAGAQAKVDAHAAAADPHPQYLTQAEGDGRYAPAGYLHPGYGTWAKTNYPTTQSIPSATATAITWDGTNDDLGGYWSSGAPTRVTIPVGLGGYYSIAALVKFTANGTGVRTVRIQKNGFDIVGRTDPSPSASGDLSVLALLPRVGLAAGDYLRVLVEQTSGAALNVKGSPDWTYLNIAFLGA